jgi:hypothetical protein
MKEPFTAIILSWYQQLATINGIVQLSIAVASAQVAWILHRRWHA